MMKLLRSVCFIVGWMMITIGFDQVIDLNWWQQSLINAGIAFMIWSESL